MVGPRVATAFKVGPTSKFFLDPPLITRYRTGSHILKIEIGRRYPYIPREKRICICNNEIQTLSHCLLRCPLLNNIREEQQVTDIQNGVMNVNFLLEMERVLNLKS